MRDQSPPRASTRRQSSDQDQRCLQRSQAIDETGVRRLRSEGLGPPEIARQLGVGRTSVSSRVGPGRCLRGGRKQIPGEALINLRRSLDMLSPRHPERITVLQNAADLYGVSRATLYRPLHCYLMIETFTPATFTDRAGHTKCRAEVSPCLGDRSVKNGCIAGDGKRERMRAASRPRHDLGDN